MLAVAEAELKRGLASLGAPAQTKGAIRLDCPRVGGAGDGAFRIHADGKGRLVIAGADHRACLYGAFALLRELALGRDPLAVALDEHPAIDRKRVESGKSVSVRVDLGGGRSIKKKKKKE